MPVTFVWDAIGGICSSLILSGSFHLTPFLSFFGTSQIGLEGEHQGIYKADGLSSVKWISTSEPPKEQPLTWYKVNT